MFSTPWVCLAPLAESGEGVAGWVLLAEAGEGVAG